jgi:hypothetical protein
VDRLLRLSPSKLSVAVSSSAPTVPKAPADAAPEASTEEPSCADLGRRFGVVVSSFAVPALEIASLAERLGMKRSAALYAIRTLDFGRGLLDSVAELTPAEIEEELRACEGVPVPVSVHSDRPNSSLRGESRSAMFDLADLRMPDLERASANLGVVWMDGGVGR